MGILMLIFALSAAGESTTVALQFPTMVMCESSRALVMEALKANDTQNDEPIIYVAVVCVEPVKVEVI